MQKNWTNNDTCFCFNECDNTDCFRNLANRNPEEKIFTAACLKDTDLCLLKQRGSDNERNG